MVQSFLNKIAIHAHVSSRSAINISIFLNIICKGGIMQRRENIERLIEQLREGDEHMRADR
ncbi:unknown [Methanothermobacter thermautotrophicus str. Delta H]|uniref:Uncharacterized protein n=1 Tax=Methanothermobacter thermautotrophicus (strain ATCC 29096 / DSM 1053 / JCM 10044 / NBRC 100330 / Delta H) TaxID=187420 RepID=O26288_METTH|nr:unknown [Methanothermobacter thermautotrophicus str. Delta H]